MNTMQRDEKQLDASIDALTTRLSELKGQLQALLYKVEHERESLSWPSVLDSFALISGQFTAISKILAHDKTPPLHNLTVLPLLLSQDRDEDLLRLTENRVPVFNHDLVPDYLRTKPDPDVEMKMQQFLHKANGLTIETAQKQTATFNKVLNHVLESTGKAREEWESESNARSNMSQQSLSNDTHMLVSVISMGKGLKPLIPQGVPPGPPGMMVPPGVRPSGAGQPPPPPGTQPNPMNPSQQPIGMMGKTPSIKTNIKSASQMHSYR